MESQETTAQLIALSSTNALIKEGNLISTQNQGRERPEKVLGKVQGNHN